MKKIASTTIQSTRPATRTLTAFTITALTLATFVTGCSPDIPMQSLGIDDVYYIERMRKLNLQPALTGAQYKWTLNGKTVSEDKDYIFLAQDEGTYHLTFSITDDNSPYHHEFDINVLHEEIEYSPYISKVHEYRPAPGQFINTMPEYTEGDTEKDMIQKAEDCISGTNDIMISLGGYGGYVTFSFDHTVINVPGEADFRIWGNCFYEATHPEEKGGSAEPGIVMVSYDANCNGIPDDPWYELAGSEYDHPSTLHNYSITYRKPDSCHIPVEDEDYTFIDDLEYIPWADSEGNEGFMPKNIFHDQSYWPQWLPAEEMTFTGSCLSPNGIDKSGTGTYYVLYSYPWGYADNHPNEYADLNSFDISNAVDSEGNRVDLPGADFVRVYTGLNQYCGWLGETSTEIARAQDLHIDLLHYSR